MLFLICQSSIFLYGQGELKPFVSVNYTQDISSRLWVHEVQIGGGVQISDQVSLQMNVRGIQDRRRSSIPGTDQTRIVTLSASPTFRILKPRYLLSPVVVIDAGTALWSNAKGKAINHHLSLQPQYANGDVLYGSGLFFSKLKLLLDIKLKSFDLFLGSSYNLYAFRIKYLKPAYIAGSSNYDGYIILSNGTSWERGFGFEATLMFTLPSKTKGKSKPLVN